MFDVVLELFAEVFHEAGDRPDCRLAERADGVAADVLADAQQLVEIFRSPLALLDAPHDAIHPAGAFAAGRALAAGFLEVEVGQPLQRLDHADAVIHDNHRAGAEHGTGLGDRIEIQRAGHHHIGRQYGGGRAARNHRLQRMSGRSYRVC